MSLPSLSQIINAPESEWRKLAALVDADQDYIERLRRRPANSDQPKSKRRNRRRSTGGTRRNRSTATIFAAMAELVKRANDESEGNE